MSISLRLASLLIPYALVFCGGLGLTMLQALGLVMPVPVEPGWNVGFGAALHAPGLRDAFGFSLYTAFVSALMAVAFGTLTAYGIWRLPHRLQTPAVVYKIPLILPHISVAFIILILWTRTGFVSSAAHAVGLIDTPEEFPALLFAGNGLGIILAYAWKGTGFVTLMAYALLKRLDPRLLTTARMLGASGPTAFVRIVLPHLAPVLHASFIILFLYGFGAFDIPFLLAESAPGMLSVEVYNLVFQRGLERRPEAMAVLTLMFAFATLFVHLYMRVAERTAPGTRKL